MHYRNPGVQVAQPPADHEDPDFGRYEVARQIFDQGLDLLPAGLYEKCAHTHRRLSTFQLP